MFLRVDFAQKLTRHLTWIVPLVTGFFSVRQANKQGEHAGTFAVAGLALVLCGLFTALYHLAHHTNLLASPAFMVWLAASALFALVCDINAVSMHSYYRSRLAEAFLPQVGKDHEGAANHPMLFRLTDVRRGRALIINTTLNTTTDDAKLRVHCGSSATGYRRTSSTCAAAHVVDCIFSFGRRGGSRHLCDEIARGQFSHDAAERPPRHLGGQSAA